MDGPGNHHTKSDREKYITSLWNLKTMIRMNLFTKQKQTRHRKQSMVTKGERQGWEGIN